MWLTDETINRRHAKTSYDDACRTQKNSTCTIKVINKPKPSSTGWHALSDSEGRGFEVQRN